MIPPKIFENKKKILCCSIKKIKFMSHTFSSQKAMKLKMCNKMQVDRLLDGQVSKPDIGHSVLRHRIHSSWIASVLGSLYTVIFFQTIVRLS